MDVFFVWYWILHTGCIWIHRYSGMPETIYVEKNMFQSQGRILAVLAQTQIQCSYSLKRRTHKSIASTTTTEMDKQHVSFKNHGMVGCFLYSRTLLEPNKKVVFPGPKTRGWPVFPLAALVRAPGFRLVAIHTMLCTKLGNWSRIQNPLPTQLEIFCFFPPLCVLGLLTAFQCIFTTVRFKLQLLGRTGAGLSKPLKHLFSLREKTRRYPGFIS